MTIESHTKNVPGEVSYFEQRARTELESKIYYFNQPVLSFPITDKNKPLAKDIIQKMHKDMARCGIGLAHNQLCMEKGATNPYAIFIIEYEGLGIPFEAFVNPIIVGYSTEKSDFYHGCLSAIGTCRARLATYQEVLIAFYSEELQLQVKKYTEMAGIICQHELNHLTTCGTYVDTVNKHFNGDRFKQAEECYLTEEIIKEQIAKEKSQKGILSHIQDAPCLIEDDVLARCKNALTSDSLIMQAVTNYLQTNPQDQLLYDNLIKIPSTTDQLYIHGHLDFDLWLQ